MTQGSGAVQPNRDASYSEWLDYFEGLSEREIEAWVARPQGFADDLTTTWIRALQIAMDRRRGRKVGSAIASIPGNIKDLFTGSGRVPPLPAQRVDQEVAGVDIGLGLRPSTARPVEVIALQEIRDDLQALAKKVIDDPETTATEKEIVNTALNNYLIDNTLDPGSGRLQINTIHTIATDVFGRKPTLVPVENVDPVTGDLISTDYFDVEDLEGDPVHTVEVSDTVRKWQENEAARKAAEKVIADELAATTATRAAASEARAAEAHRLSVDATQIKVFETWIDNSEFKDLITYVEDGNNPEPRRLDAYNAMLDTIGQALRFADIKDPDTIESLTQLKMPGPTIEDEDLDRVFGVAEVERPTGVQTPLGPSGPIATGTQFATPRTRDLEDEALRIAGSASDSQSLVQGTDILPLTADPQASSPSLTDMSPRQRLQSAARLKARREKNLQIAEMMAPGGKMEALVKVVASGVATQRIDYDKAWQMLDAAYQFGVESIDFEGDFDPGFDAPEYITGLTNSILTDEMTMAQALDDIHRRTNQMRVSRNDARKQRNLDRTLDIEKRNLERSFRVQARTENQRRREQEFSALANIDSAQQARDLQLFQMISGMSLAPATPGAVLGGSDVIAELARRTGGPVAEPSPVGGPIAFPSSADTFDAARRKVMETFATTPIEELIQ